MGFAEIELRKHVIGALLAQPIRWVNFKHANRGIAPVVFYQFAAAVKARRVKTKIKSGIKGRVAYYDPNDNAIIASDSSFGERNWDEKALLIHESAHAILDGIYKGKTSLGKRDPMKVVDDEVIGYLAGAFYLVAAKASGSSRTAPERAAIKIARSKLNPRPQWDGCLTFTFTRQELQPLRNAIISGYKDWNEIALHDGF